MLVRVSVCRLMSLALCVSCVCVCIYMCLCFFVFVCIRVRVRLSYLCGVGVGAKVSARTMAACNTLLAYVIEGHGVPWGAFSCMMVCHRVSCCD